MLILKPTPSQQEQVSNMKIGEIWYVRVDDNLLLDKKRISDLTVRTVEIETLDYFFRLYLVQCSGFIIAWIIDAG